MKLWEHIVSWTVLTVGKIHWRTKSQLSTEHQAQIRKLLTEDYYVILTHRRNHLSTFFIGLANFVLAGRWSYWSHALMNMEDEVNSDSDFRLVEAISDGVVYSPFEKVFDVHGAVLLKPKNMTLEKWTAVLDKAKTALGTPYDTLFDLRSDRAMSCVELVRSALMAEPGYYENFANFEAMISERKNLTPQMFYECEDFEIAYEARI